MISQLEEMCKFHRLIFDRVQKFAKAGSLISKILCFVVNFSFLGLKALSKTKQKFRPLFAQRNHISQTSHHHIFFESRTNFRGILKLDTVQSWQDFVRLPTQIDILIIGTPFLRQCFEYRIRNKIQQLEKLGAKVAFVPYNEPEQCYLKVPTAKKIIFYRIPMCPAIDQIYGLAESLGKDIYWEIDDLVFAPGEYKNHPYLKQCPEAEKTALMSESMRFLEAFNRAHKVICSTLALENCMRELGKSDVYLVENVLSDEIVDLSDKSLASIREHRTRKIESGIATVSIGYGSGSKSHDHDFASIARPVQNALRSHANCRLVIFGSLNLPEGFEGLQNQILMVGSMEPKKYYEAMSYLDIALAPLPLSRFNEAKSNIKLLEAGIFEIPCVCHSRQPFMSIARHNTNAMVCETELEWKKSLEMLILHSEMRWKLGTQVRKDILSSYTSFNNNQLRFLLND